jgi:hypothetical protein
LKRGTQWPIKTNSKAIGTASKATATIGAIRVTDSPVRAVTAIEIVRVQETTAIEVDRVKKEADRIKVGRIGIVRIAIGNTLPT